ncbi:MAG: TonB-dependent receptor, partial [Saprospiraceae bacterium]
MKLISQLLIMLFACLAHGAANAQNMSNTKIKGDYQNKSLDLVLLDLEINYRLQFDYEEDEIQDIIINQSFGKLPLADAMKVILSGTGLAYETIPPKTVRVFKGTLTKKESVSPSSHQPLKKNFTLNGTIKDANTGETLPFSTIQVRGTSIGASANVDGQFTLFEVPSDTVVLTVQYLGYRTKYLRLAPTMDFTDFSINLEDFSQELSEVLVIAEKEEQLLKASTGISKISVSPAQLAYLPSFGEKDIFRSLQLLPGISGSQENSSGLFVRGGTPDQNLILFDGFTVYHVDHLFGFFSAFNSNAIKDVQLYKGGFEAKYGGRLSSVVELTGKDGNSEEFNVGGGLSLLSVNAFVEAPLFKGKGSFLVAGRRSFQSNFYSDLFDSFTEANEGTTENTPNPGGRPGGFGQQRVQPNSYFYDLNGKMTFRPTKKDVIALSFYNGQDDLDNSRITDNNSFTGGPFGGGGSSGNSDFNFQSSNTDITQWGNWGASLKYARKWSDRFYTNANISYSNYFSERDRRDEITITRSDTTTNRITGSYENNDLKDVTLKIDNEFNISQANKLEFGLQATYNDIAYEFTQNDSINILDREDTGLTSSIYVQDKHTFSDKLILTGGLRTTYYDVNNKLYLEPRASFTYLLSDRIRLKGAYGKYNQQATRIVREDIQQGSRDFWLLADDERVPVSASEHFIGGISYETPAFLFDVEAYYKKLDGLSEYTTRLTPSGFGPNQTLDYEELFFTGTGVAKG